MIPLMIIKTIIIYTISIIGCIYFKKYEKECFVIYLIHSMTVSILFTIYECCVYFDWLD